MQHFDNVTIFDHPLIQHKIAILRNENTGMKEFRELVEEITTLMVFEAFKEVPTKKVMVKTPLELTEQTMVEDNAVTIRERDSMEQERVKIEDLEKFLDDKLNF